MLCYLGSMFNMVCSAVLGDLEPSPYSRCRFLLVGGSILCRSSRPSVLHLDMGLLTHFTPPSLLALPAMTQFSEWQLPSFSSLSASINGYRHHPSALHTCSSRGALPKHLTRGLHPSSVDAPGRCPQSKSQLPIFPPLGSFSGRSSGDHLTILLSWHYFCITSRGGSLARGGTGTPVPCMMGAHT